ncbi:MAG TPA: succinate dehydrogenase iron-sulfur subunit [Chloroflexota bacterium]|nr:succinate dehydrogenase iron-sulfur subunit [Chloroflexota bacterium]
MKSVLSVQRFIPEIDEAPHFESYELDLPDEATILDGLTYIKENIDDSLTFRRSCRSAICGSCSMVVNGYSKLTCKSPIAVELRRGRDEIVITPMRTMRVIKDLVVDMAPYWQHFRDVEPYLQPDPNKVPGKMEEYVVLPEQLAPSRRDLNCIQCAVCYSDCGVTEVSAEFAGPPALAKAHRFVTDPRDSKRRQRLEKLVDLGLWDCAHAYNCMECPKHVNPADAIADLRRMSIAEGITDNLGARHSQAFTENVERSGRLNESALVPETLGYTNISALLPIAPQGAMMALKGKMPLPIFHRKVDNYDEVKKIYAAFAKTSEDKE